MFRKCRFIGIKVGKSNYSKNELNETKLPVRVIAQTAKTRSAGIPYSNSEFKTTLSGADAEQGEWKARADAKIIRQNSQRSTVLALGDSLTLRLRRKPGESCAQLQETDGLEYCQRRRIGRYIRPSPVAPARAVGTQTQAMVIVGIGGNDFLRKVPKEQTRANIAKIIETVQERKTSPSSSACRITLGALFGHLSDHPLYMRLSEEYGIPLFGGAWAEILGDNNLKSDQIHASGKGYRKFAEDLNQFLKNRGFR